MLLAVEGGGFFSSSATGYSKGLTLLILGNRKEKPMRVLPWNQYQLVDREIDTDLQLASWKNRLSCGCASFVCFGHSSAGLDGQSALKVGPTEPQDILSCGTTNEKHKELSMSIDDDNARHLSLKSSLKKPSHNVPISAKNVSERETLGEGRIDIHGFMERRKVQWTDACGKELAEVREFELSETGGSDNEYENGNGKTCSCKIM
ncbi:hypothetical protein Nepgr_033476 [Nepenthes gracilis]|uniref:Uncharacterized protein n=1 Tax=Nepenthes gracilis TaxID=150966 RepID=A0AAD3Y6M0_NEPGR|nr:hypothetical protein Nepgr_033476 [Nepenthes gracilis]